METKETGVEVLNPTGSFLDIYNKEGLQKAIAGLPNAKTLMDHGTARMNFAVAYKDDIDKLTPELREASLKQINVINVLAGIRYQEELKAAMNAGVNLGFTLIGNNEDFLHLQLDAKALGIDLSGVMALPAPTEKDPDQMQIQFKDGDAVIKNKELKQRMKDDVERAKTYVEEQPEIDHTKIKKDDVDDIRKALLYYMNDRTLFAGMHEAIDWYRNFMSYHKLKSDDAKEALDIPKNMSAGEVLAEILDIATPTAIMTGLGSTIYTTTSRVKSIIPAHCLAVKNAGALFNQTDIADIVKTIVEKKAKWNIDSLANNVDAEGNNVGKKVELVDDAAFRTILEAPSSEELDKILSQDVNEKEPQYKEIYGRAFNTFYGNATNIPSDKELFLKQFRNILGCIMNLYATSNNRLSEFDNLDPETVIQPQKIEVETEKTEGDEKK